MNVVCLNSSSGFYRDIKVSFLRRLFIRSTIELAEYEGMKVTKVGLYSLIAKKFSENNIIFNNDEDCVKALMEEFNKYTFTKYLLIIKD